jgi:hypothetical protein
VQSDKRPITSADPLKLCEIRRGRKVFLIIFSFDDLEFFFRSLSLNLSNESADKKAAKVTEIDRDSRCVDVQFLVKPIETTET